MRRAILCVAVLMTFPASAAAQDAPKWDFNFSFGGHETRLEDLGNQTGENSYRAGRYAVTIGRYWGDHFETELEYAATGEGSRSIAYLIPAPTNATPALFEYEQFYRLQQGSARLVWQILGHRSRVQPYVNGGWVFEVERRRSELPPQTLGGTQLTIADPDYEYRRGFIYGGGVKFRVSSNAYVNGGVQATSTRPTTTITYLAGLGFVF